MNRKKQQALLISYTQRLIRLFSALFYCLFLCYCPVTAQTGSKKFAFSPITINEGLSQGLITCMIQDRYGFMWFATLDGLNRYDGYKFTVYRHNPRDVTSITESHVTSLFEDSAGRLWIGTSLGGLDLFNRETETFSHLKNQPGNANSLASGSINSISEDRQGNIWVHVENKLEKVTINKTVKTAAFDISHVRLPFTSTAAFLFITKSGKIFYVDGAKGIIYQFSNKDKTSWSVVFRLDNPVLKGSDSAHYRIVQLLEDTLKKSLYIFHESGAICSDINSGAVKRVYRNNFFANFESASHGAIDRNGIVWFASTNIFLFDTNSGEFTKAEVNDPDLVQTLTAATNLYIDHSRLLWIGSSGYGVLKQNPRSEAFHHTGNSSDYSIKEADKGRMIIGDDRPIKSLFDKRSGKFISALAGSKDKDDTAGLAAYLHPPFAVDGNGSWSATRRELSYRDNASQVTTKYALPVVANNQYLIQDQLKDSSGNIWLGTSNGLLRFSIYTKQWKVYNNRPEDSSSLSSNMIFSLRLDPLMPEKFIWIGTAGSGLNRMDMLTGKCELYTVKDGLPNDVIYGILRDDEGNLWMSTNKGLSCFNPLKKTFRNFDYKDGLQSNEFNRNAYCRTKDGWLFFGGVNGFNYFDPKEILGNTTVPQIVITGLKILNQPVQISSEGSPLSKAIYLTEKLTLPFEQNMISFEFASMDFANPNKNQYQYKLEGFDKEFIHSGNINNATYTNLDPGTYTFVVKGSNSDGIWNEKGTSVLLQILPPVYMTWWFRTAIVLIILLAIFAFYRFRLNQALKLQAIRDRIAGDLHDEVGSNLSNIYIFSNVAQQKAKRNEETGPLLQKITDYTQQSMEAMNDIVWMINTRNDSFENIMIHMRTLAAEFCESSECNMHLDFDEALNKVRLDMEDRKNFYLIYKEAINNTAKYAGCKELWIEMKLNQGIVTLRIRDDGKGFDLANATRGNGLLNMKKRAEMLKGDLTVTSTPGGGTALNLSFKV